MATSVASARVGRGDVIIDSSICVAVTTGLLARLHFAMISFWMIGTVFDRHLDAEIAARDHDPVGGGDDGVEVVERFVLFDLGDDGNALAARRR